MTQPHSAVPVRLSIAQDHPAFAGHFPGHPIVPGVVLLDRAQRAIEQALGEPLIGVVSAKFLSPVRPGEQPELMWACRGSAVDFTITLPERTVSKGRFARHDAA